MSGSFISRCKLRYANRLSVLAVLSALRAAPLDIMSSSYFSSHWWRQQSSFTWWVFNQERAEVATLPPTEKSCSSEVLVGGVSNTLAATPASIWFSRLLMLWLISCLCFRRSRWKMRHHPLPPLHLDRHRSEQSHPLPSCFNGWLICGCRPPLHHYYC